MSGEDAVTAEPGDTQAEAQSEAQTEVQIEVMAAVAEVNAVAEVAVAPLPARTGRLFVVSGPSGVGKDVLLERLFVSLPGLVRSVSATTRDRRENEVDGVDYHFLTTEQFEAGIAADLFLEHARYNGRYYGTPQARVAEQLARGQDVVLKIEVQGAQTVRRLMPEAVLIFILPPSLAVLEQRLRGRKTDDEEKIAARLRIARDEIAAASQYDYTIVNDRLDVAVDVLRCIIIAERHRVGLHKK